MKYLHIAFKLAFITLSMSLIHCSDKDEVVPQWPKAAQPQVERPKPITLLPESEVPFHYASCEALRNSSEDLSNLQQCLQDINTHYYRYKFSQNRPFIVVSLSSIEGLSAFAPDVSGAESVKYYSGFLEGKKVFVKLLYPDLEYHLSALQRPRGATSTPTSRIVNEYFMTQFLAHDKMGPRLFGMTIAEHKGKVYFGIITEFIDGTTIKLSQGSPKWHNEAVAKYMEVWRKTYPFLSPDDPNYMISKNNDVYLIDSGPTEPTDERFEQAFLRIP